MPHFERISSPRPHSAPLPDPNEATPFPQRFNEAIAQIASQQRSASIPLLSGRIVALSDLEELTFLDELFNEAIETLNLETLAQIPRVYLMNHSHEIEKLRNDYARMEAIIAAGVPDEEEPDWQNLDLVKISSDPARKIQFLVQEYETEKFLRAILDQTELTQSLASLLKREGWSDEELTELRQTETENDFRYELAFQIMERTHLRFFKLLPFENLTAISNEVTRSREIYQKMVEMSLASDSFLTETLH